MTHKNPDMIINGVRVSALAEEKQQDDKRVGELNIRIIEILIELPSPAWPIDIRYASDEISAITEQAVVEAVEGLIDIEGEKHGYITDKIRNEHFTEAISAIRKAFNPTGEKE